MVFDVAVIGGGVVSYGCPRLGMHALNMHGRHHHQPHPYNRHGQVGSATAWRAAKRIQEQEGKTGGVLLLEQFEAGHAHGSSHGDGRIFRSV